MMDTNIPICTHKKNMASPANSISAAADVDDVPFLSILLSDDYYDDDDGDDDGDDVEDLGRLHLVTIARFDVGDDDNKDGDDDYDKD